MIAAAHSGGIAKRKALGLSAAMPPGSTKRQIETTGGIAFAAVLGQ